MRCLLVDKCQYQHHTDYHVIVTAVRMIHWPNYVTAVMWSETEECYRGHIMHDKRWTTDCKCTPIWWIYMLDGPHKLCILPLLGSVNRHSIRLNQIDRQIDRQTDTVLIPKEI